MTAMTGVNGRHDRFRELAATALDFPLTTAEAAELGAHLATCGACARLAGGLRFDAAALRRPAELATSYRLDTAVGAAIAGRRAPGQASRTLLLVAATALLAAALLGAAAVGAYLWRTLNPPLVVDPSPPVTNVEPSPAPSGEPGPAIPALTWQIGSIPPMVAGRDAAPVAVAGGDGGFVAVGGRFFIDNQTPSGPTASAWHSKDGLAWKPAGTDGLALGGSIPVDDEPQPGIADVAWGPAGWVAVGIDIDGNGNRVGALWNSADGGVTWERLLPRGDAADPEVAPDMATFRPASLTWDGSAYVLVGVVREQGAPRAAAWRSTNGRAFIRDETNAFDIGGYVTLPSAMGSGGLADVTAAPDGSLVAVGFSCTATASMDEQSACRPIVVRSADGGETWAAIPGPNVTGIGIPSVAAQRGRFVAVAGGAGSLRYVQATGPVGGNAGTAQVAVGDAGGWRLVEPPGVPALDRVVAFGGQFLAVSSAGNRIRLWASPDGETWTEVPGIPQPPVSPEHPSDQEAFSDVDLAVAGNRVVITGRNQADPVGATAFSIVGTSPTSGVPDPADTLPAGALLLGVAGQMGDNESGMVFTLRPDDGQVENLASGVVADWSPDGRSIVYMCREGASGPYQDICVMSADGTGRQRIIANGENPSWSPDGRRILFTRALEADPRQAHVWIANVDGSSARDVGPGKGRWSPGGDWVLLLDGSRRWAATILRPDGSGARSVGECSSDAAWSPDGGRIACRREVDGRGQLTVIDVATGATTVIFDTEAGVGLPAWVSVEPDLLAFTMGSGSDDRFGDVYVLAPGTGEVRRLARGPIDPPLDVSPDGRWIAFVQNLPMGPDRALRLVSITGEERSYPVYHVNGTLRWQPRPDAGSSSAAPWPPPLVGLPACGDAPAPADQWFASGVVHTDYAWTPHAFRRSDAVGGVALAQTVTAGRAGLLAGLELRLTGRDLAGDLPVEVRDGAPDGALLGRGTLGRADLEAGGWIRVELDPAPVVRVGQVVAIVLPALAPTHSADSAAAQPMVTWVSSLEANGDYPGGTGLAGTRDGQDADVGSWDSFVHDRHVRTYVCAPATES